jgi:4-amino-4-deoxy-L-arabinose transferase-like glycosyltransferase
MNRVDTTGATNRIRATRLLLVFIVLTALLLRLWGINHDLPNIYHPDEPVTLFITQTMLKTGDLHPHFFHWPSLIFYVNLLAYIPYYLLGKLLGAFQTPENILAPVQLGVGIARTQMPTTVLLGRLVTVSFGTGSVLLTYLIGRQLTNRIWVGLLAALMMAVSPTNVGLGHWMTPDTIATFFILASALASIYVFQQGQTWQYVIAGICIGLAASGKYNGALALILLLSAHFLRHGWRGFKGRNLYLALAISGLSFLITTPFAILDLPEFLAGMKFNMQHYSTGHDGMEGNTLRWYLEYLWRTTGLISIVAALAIAYGILTKSKEVILLSSFPLVYFVFIGRLEVRNDRTILPLTPFLFILASAVLVRLYKQVPKLRSRAFRAVSVVVLSTTAIISLTIPAVSTIELGIQTNTLNSRETARIWIEDNLPPGTKVAIEAYAPFVDPTRFSVKYVGWMINQTPEWYIDHGFEYLVFSEGMFGRFYHDPDRYGAQVAQYDHIFERFPLLQIFTDGGHEVRIYRVPEEPEE